MMIERQWISRTVTPAAVALAVAVAFLFVSAVVLTPAAGARDLTPAIVYGLGGRFDKSFNQSAFEGVQRFVNDTAITVAQYELDQDSADGRIALMDRAIADGATLVIAVGFDFSAAVGEVANRPASIDAGLRFTLIDGFAEAPILQRIAFQEHQGSFLVGALAALKSKTGVIGFVGGQESDLIRKFRAGYTAGARHVRPDITVVWAAADDSSAPYNDPLLGAALANVHIDNGADVIYAAAGKTGHGVYLAAAMGDRWAIGVDSNQNYLMPGTMLTSMLKRVDVGVYNTLMAAHAGRWEPGDIRLGLAEDGVAVAIDRHNRDLLPDGAETRLDRLRHRIISGEITVPQQPDP